MVVARRSSATRLHRLQMGLAGLVGVGDAGVVGILVRDLPPALPKKVMNVRRKE